jgi:Transglutaminase-like superfamily
MVKAALVLGLVRLCLRMLPFRTVVSLLHRAVRVPIAVSATSRFPPDRLAWAIEVAGPYLLGAKPCLAQALTMQLFLGRRGYRSRLHLGVARGAPGSVQAHAWVETDGRIVIGGSASQLEHYTPLLALDARLI